METKITNILENVQNGSFNHQKNIKLLESVYNSVPFEEFLDYFLKIIQSVLLENYKNPCYKLLLEFLAKFVGYIARIQSTHNESELEDDPPTHPFLGAVIEEVVRHHNLPLTECRYNACNFVSLTLLNIGCKTQMDGKICDYIQVAMLENIRDVEPVIRLQALSALVRLQDPLNPDCPVVRAYTECLKDVNPLVRREATKRIAPNALTIPKLKDKTADKDANVRSAAFTHVADIGIRHFKIVHRQFILKSGFNEANPHVKKIFLEYLLPKWLIGLNGDYIAFLKSIKLDAEELDILNTEELSRRIMELFFQTEPIDSLIRALPLDNNKVIPLNEMSTENAYYWNILTKHLRKSEETDEYLDIINPELTSYCNYLDKLINTKFSKTMEDWEYLDFQYTLYHLFDIAEHYDLSDVVGRRTLDSLVNRVVRNYRIQPRLLSKIIQVARKLASSVDSFTNEMCLIISDIREPLIEQEPSPHEKRENDFKRAELTVKLNILCGDLEDATDEKDFQRAQVLGNEIEELRRNIDGLNSQSSQVTKVRMSKDDPETICWCLDLLSCVLVNSNIKTLSPSLITCWEAFLKPLISSQNVEIGWRVFKCLAAYCVFDKKMAKEHLKQLIVPIASYRVIPNFNKTVLIVSISIISDLIRIHGTELFSTEADQNTNSCTQTSTRRRLYNGEEVDDVDTISNQMSLEVIVNVILDMLDDESSEINNTAVTAVAKLILNGFTVNSMVLTRLILKWYNPATQKILQQKLGTIIKAYTERIKDSKEVVAKSVIPILTNIAEAPRTSPLAEVDIANVIKFLAAITDGTVTNGIIHIHRELAHTLIREIGSRPAEVVTPHQTKMLTALNIAPDNSAPTKELVAQAKLLLEQEALDKGSKLNIAKFIGKLNGNMTAGNSVITTGLPSNETAGQSSANTVSRRLYTITEGEGNEANENGKDKTEEGSKDVLQHQSDAVAVVASIQEIPELVDEPNQRSGTNPDIISPSVSPDSQKETSNNLRKRTQNNASVQTAQSKKKKVDSEGSQTTKTKDKDVNSKISRKNKKVESNSLNCINDDRSNGKEVTTNSIGSEETEGNVNKENLQTGTAKKASENNKAKDSNKSKEKDTNKEVVSFNLGLCGTQTRRSTRIILSNNLPPNILRNNATQKLKEVRSSMGKETSRKSRHSTETPTSSDSSSYVDTEQPKVTRNENPNTGFQKSTGERRNCKLRKQPPTDTVSASSESSSSKKRARSRQKNATSEQNKPQTRSHSLERVKDKQRTLGANVLQSSASESSLSLSTRSSTLNSTPVTMEKRRQTEGDNSASSSVENEIVGGRLRPRENGRTASSIKKNCRNQISRLSFVPSKQGQTGNSDNNNGTTSQSSSSSVIEVNKGRRGKVKNAKGLNNNRVDEKQEEVKANGILKNVQKSVSTPQVKRKKARGALAKNVKEVTVETCEDLSDGSDQSLHTIVEPSEAQMSLLQYSMENSRQKSLRHSRILQVVISDTSSDSESSSSPIRRSSRKKKVNRL